MLERYDGKLIRITTEDGDVFTGEAESLPSGYGLVEFDRAEESVCIDDVQIFHSEIRKIEVLTDSPAPVPVRDRYDDLMGRLLEGPYQIADVLPEQDAVPAHFRRFRHDGRNMAFSPRGLCSESRNMHGTSPVASRR